MALFRYRYVDFGTVFTGDPRMRDVGGAADSPTVLFANELATDIGGTCWGVNEPLPILDHHFARQGQFPSSSAAVLHKAHLIRERFARPPDLVWLVTHKQPDFDAFASLYLARWIISDPVAAINWEGYGLHPDGWLDLPQQPRIDWFHPDLSAVPPEHRWPILLAGYASMLDGRRPIHCPRPAALHSILYAALKRGREYRNQTSGATEFFDTVRQALLNKQLNPVFDAVLDDSESFAPERSMLDGEAQAYARDIARARKSIVYLPESEAPTPDFFKRAKHAALLQEVGAAPAGDPGGPSLADTFRIPADGIYLRDPECQLFTEWARLDLENSALGAGFEFTAIAESQALPDAAVNHSAYCFAIDPERAHGRHLYTVWSRLQTKEVEALRSHGQMLTASPLGPRAGATDALLAHPWFGGQSQYGTLVRTPDGGSLIAKPGMRADLRDDPVAAAVRIDLEAPIYATESLVTGAQIMVRDLTASPASQDLAPRQFDLNDLQNIPPPADRYVRFAQLRLLPDVPLAAGDRTSHVLAQQIGETLWQVLYPESLGSLPPDFVERHLVTAPDSVAVWADRGVALAQKNVTANSPAPAAVPLHDEFAELVSLLRDIGHFSATWESLSQPWTNTARDDRKSLATLVSAGEELARRVVRIKQVLTLPGRDLLRCFSDSIAADRVVEMLRDLNHAATERLRREEASDQAKRMEQRSAITSQLRRRMAWLGVFVAGFFATAAVDLIARQLPLDPSLSHALLLVGPLVLVLMAIAVRPWKRKNWTPEIAVQRSTWILIVALLACLAVWISGLLQLWGK